MTAKRIALVLAYLLFPAAFSLAFRLLSEDAAFYPPLYSMAIGAGISSYALFCLQFVLAARPRFVERAFGLDSIFRIHIAMALAATALAIAHRQLFIAARGEGSDYWAYVLGRLALLAYLAAGVAALLFLAKTPLSRLKPVAALVAFGRKAGFNYGRSKAMHNLTLLISALACAHAFNVPAVAFYPALRAAMAVPFALALGFWLYHKAGRPTRSYALRSMTQLSPLVTRLEAVPKGRRDAAAFAARKAGQFAFVRLRPPAPGAAGLTREFHPFTISSPPSADGSLAFSVKAAGDWTMALYDAIGAFPGSDAAAERAWGLEIDGPYGRFCLEDRTPRGCEAGPLVFIAGGIGITPFLSMAGALGKDSGRRVLILWGARTRDDLAGLDELIPLSGRGGSGVRTVPILSNDPLWEGRKGFVDRAAIAELAAEELADPRSSYWICGPEPMRILVVKALRALGVPRRRIRYENFSL